MGFGTRLNCFIVERLVYGAPVFFVVRHYSENVKETMFAWYSTINCVFAFNNFLLSIYKFLNKCGF